MARCKAFVLLGLLWASANAALALDNYHATYDVQIRGIQAGKVRHEAIFTANTYRIDTFAKPSGAAKLLGYGDIRETVTGLLQNGEVKPEHYQRAMQGDAQFQLDYRFKPEQKRIDAVAGGKAQSIAYTDEIPLDILSMVVQSLSDLERGQTRSHYSLLNETQVRRYQVEALPDEMWQGNIAVKVFRQVHNNRETRIYIAPNPLRLLALTQVKDGKTRFALNLVDYHTP